jgi:hypothetical protein
MAFARQADLELDSETLQEEEFGSDYDGFFEDFDYAALGINPTSPTPAKPGSEDKVRVLAARYAAGLPLWHDEDCYDHGPAQALLNNDEEDFEEEEEEE